MVLVGVVYVFGDTIFTQTCLLHWFPSVLFVLERVFVVRPP